MSKDNINPDHYKAGEIECIDGIKSAVIGLGGFEAFMTGTIIKYMWRWRKKNGLEDLKKAKWYLDQLIAIIQANADKNDQEVKSNEK